VLSFLVLTSTAALLSFMAWWGRANAGSAPERIAANILDLAERLGQGPPHSRLVRHGLSQLELAQLSGLGRETVNRVIYDFRRRGWLRPGVRQLTVLETRALERFARNVLL
jgi:CRP-like cAMP-binding protein